MNEQQMRDFNELKECMKSFGGNYDYDLVERAFKVCVAAHEGQKRRSQEDYYIHPFNVAKIIVSLGLDSQSIAASLLHDVVEDTDATISATVARSLAVFSSAVSMGSICITASQFSFSPRSTSVLSIASWISSISPYLSTSACRETITLPGP